VVKLGLWLALTLQLEVMLESDSFSGLHHNGLSELEDDAAVASVSTGYQTTSTPTVTVATTIRNLDTSELFDSGRR
jgi:hypothetical protein